MNYIFTLVVFFLTLLSIRKTIYLYPIIMVLTPPALLLIQNPSLPLLSVANAIVLGLFLYFMVLLLSNKQVLKNKKNLLKTFYGFFFLLFSFLLVLLFSKSPFIGANTILMKFFAMFFPAFLYTFYYQDKDEMFHIKEIKLVVFVLFLVGLYGTISLFTSTNIYADMIQSTLHTDLVQIYRYQNDFRGERAFGTLSHPITYGAFLAIGFFSSLFLVAFYSTIIKKKFFIVVGGILMLFIVFFVFTSNSRTPLLFIFSGVIVLFLLSKIKIKMYVLGICFLLLPMITQIDYTNQKLLGVVHLFDSNIGQDQKGSSFSMRLEQLRVSYNYFIDNPVFGHGFHTTRNIISSGLGSGLYGAESLLYKIMIDMGIIGGLGYVAFFTWFYVLIFRLKIKHRILKHIVYAYITGYLLFILGTGVMDTMQFFVFVFYLFYWTLYNLEGSSIEKQQARLQISK